MINIGVFDSGVGGLWILKHLKEALPLYNYVFFGDEANVPYGDKSMEEIKNFSEKITEFLINKNCQIIVIACNTASAASLMYLREKFPEIVFVGMEPAVKPAVLSTNTKKVGVLATPATFQGEPYHSVVDRFAQDVLIYMDTCPGLVDQIEKNELTAEKTRGILERALRPMIEDNIDTVVLGCTHYPFVVPLIKKIVGDKIKIIDPTEAIVRRVLSLAQGLDSNFSDKKNGGNILLYTSSNQREVEHFVETLFETKIYVNKVDLNND